MKRKVKYISHGRYGYVVYTDGHEDITLYYEFGGGNCVATIEIPTAEEWYAVTKRQPEERNDILLFIAEQVIKDQAPGCYYQLTPRWIQLLEKE